MADTVFFGGQRWLTAGFHGPRPLLLREKALPAMAFCVRKGPCSWPESQVRSFLNGAFLDSFSPADKDLIATVTLTDIPNPRFSREAVEVSEDSVFLPSVSEVISLFGDSGQLLGGNPSSKYWINDGFNGKRTAVLDSGQRCWWWTRSAGMHPDTAVYVNTAGSVNLAGHRVYNPFGALRPALALRDASALALVASR